MLKSKQAYDTWTSQASVSQLCHQGKHQ